MSEERKSAGRRTFLVGLLTGAGAMAALGAARRQASAKPGPAPSEPASGPILYRRTEDVERYYRTLYR